MVKMRRPHQPTPKPNLIQVTDFDAGWMHFVSDVNVQNRLVKQVIKFLSNTLNFHGDFDYKYVPIKVKTQNRADRENY